MRWLVAWCTDTEQRCTECIWATYAATAGVILVGLTVSWLLLEQCA